MFDQKNENEMLDYIAKREDAAHLENLETLLKETFDQLGRNIKNCHKKKSHFRRKKCNL